MHSPIPAPHAPDLSRSAAPPVMHKVLVVDDADEPRRLIGILVRQLGCKLLQAASGEEAVAIFQSQQPDMVLMDVCMPGMGGLEATRRIKALAVET